MSTRYRMIRFEDYKGEPIQFVGWYVLRSKDLNLPEGEK